MKHTQDIAAVRRKQLAAWVAKNAVPAKEKSLFSQLLNGKSSFGERVSRRLEHDYGMPPFFLDGFDLGSHPLQESADIPYGYIDHRANYTHISIYDVQPGEQDRSLVWAERPNDGPILIKKSGIRSKPISPQTCRALFIRGDSMRPELNDWDVVVVDTGDIDIIDGEIYAVTYKGQLFIKKLIRGAEGIQLISTNTLYPPLLVANTEDTPLVVLGRKVWRGG